MKKIPTVYLKRNDLQPYYYFHVTDSNGDDIDVSSATIRVNMIHVQSLTTIISRQTAGVSFTDTVNGDSASVGKGHYSWASSDTAIAGKFKFEIEVTPISGGKFTLPSGPEKALVVITSDFDLV